MILPIAECRSRHIPSCTGVPLAPSAYMVRLLFILDQILPLGGNEKSRWQLKRKLRESRQLLVVGQPTERGRRGHSAAGNSPA
jgi:hypothetical protein